MPEAPVREKLDQWLATVPGVTCFTQKMKVYALTCYGRCEKEVEELVASLIETLGGCTVYDRATGCWFDDEKGRVECEPVRVIEAAHSCADNAKLSKIVQAITTYAEKTGQQAVSVVNGQFFIAETERLIGQFDKLRKSLPY
jgi:hypothetical protein